MKTLTSLILLTSVLFGMGADTIESLTLCKNSKDTYLVTISNNETEGRAIWFKGKYSGALELCALLHDVGNYETLGECALVYADWA